MESISRLEIAGLVGPQLNLNPIENSDLVVVHMWRNDPLLSIPLASSYYPQTLQETEEWYAKNQSDKNQRIFGIYLTAERKLIGIVRLMFIDWINRHAETGILIGTDLYRNKGVGKEALILLFKYGFHYLNLHKLYCKIPESNRASLRLHQGLGMISEGILRKHYFSPKNGYEDLHCFGILRDEFHG